MDWTRRRLLASGGTVAVAAVAGCLDDGGDGADADGSDDTDADDGGGADAGDNGGETDVNGGDDGGENDDGATDATDVDAALENADIEDYTGRDEVEITVDPEDGFEPEAVEIETDTVVRWNWTGTSTEVYPLDIPDECVWDEEVDAESAVENSSGDDADRLFWADGAYLYGSRNADDGAFTGVLLVTERGQEDNENGEDDTDADESA
ncbi:hypothetical protein [Natronolimnohabitans innermongolicus]|nr:hypothetical protein [Natronolimnohabitans innermongolicus]